MSDGAPKRYSHDVRDDLDELIEAHQLERRSYSDDDMLLLGSDVLVEASDFALNMDTGGVTCDLRVETPDVQATLRAAELKVFGIGFSVEDVADGRRLRLHGID